MGKVKDLFEDLEMLEELKYKSHRFEEMLGCFNEMVKLEFGMDINEIHGLIEENAICKDTLDDLSESLGLIITARYDLRSSEDLATFVNAVTSDECVRCINTLMSKQ